MNNEIKLRCWIPHYKEFKYWGFINNTFIGVPTGSNMSIEDCQKFSQLFTGIKYKDKEIYEGDIIKLINENNDIFHVVVKFKEGAFAVEYDFGDYDITAIGWALQMWESECCEIEIIGNIFETPELIKL